jgi:hypothetical protein
MSEPPPHRVRQTQHRSWHHLGMTDDINRTLDDLLEQAKPDPVRTMRRRISAREKQAAREKRNLERYQIRSKILPQEGYECSEQDAKELNRILNRIGKRGKMAVLSQADIVRNAAKYLGSLGGKKGSRKGGIARMEALTAGERSELGRKAAAARWKARKK